MKMSKLTQEVTLVISLCTVKAYIFYQSTKNSLIGTQSLDYTPRRSYFQNGFIENINFTSESFFNM